MFNSRLMASRSLVCQRLARFSHSIQSPPASLIQNETPVLVYQAKEHEGLKNCRGAGSDALLISSNQKSKFFSLVPFLIESHFTPKNFVLQMQFYPEAKMLEMDVLHIDGVHTVQVPVGNVIPITKYDYWAASWRFWCKQHPDLDLDMIYANRSTKEMFVFDKTGEWNQEGVDHEGLNMENTYNETNWYDEFSVHNF